MLRKKKIWCELISLEKIHGGKWLLVHGKGQEWQPKGNPKVGESKCPLYIRAFGMLYKVEQVPFTLRDHWALEIAT